MRKNVPYNFLDPNIYAVHSGMAWFTFSVSVLSSLGNIGKTPREMVEVTENYWQITIFMGIFGDS